MMLLACMRMVCDTPAILDPTCRVSPKLEELEGVLDDLLEEPDRKIIVFSEWERMLDAGARARRRDRAWRWPGTPARCRSSAGAPRSCASRRIPACRLFLSTDSGSVGLNLQAASAVVNVDLPWNPAKLEQRIARAWRKNQTRSVDGRQPRLRGLASSTRSCICSAQKQALADGVLDGEGDLAALKMPSGRARHDRAHAGDDGGAGAPAPRIVSAEEALADELAHRHGERALLIEARTGADGRVRLLAVLDLDGEALAAEAKRHEAARASAPVVEVIDRATWLAMRRLAAGGMITMAQGRAARPAPVARLRGRRRSRPRSACAGWPPCAQRRTRSLRMARVLAAGGFADEALPLVAKAIGVGAAAKLAALGELAVGATMATPAQVRDLVDRGALVPQAELALSALWSSAGAGALDKLPSLIEMGALVIAGLDEGQIATAA